MACATAQEESELAGVASQLLPEFEQELCDPDLALPADDNEEPASTLSYPAKQQ